jgi:hypothetical protein
MPVMRTSASTRDVVNSGRSKKLQKRDFNDANLKEVKRWSRSCPEMVGVARSKCVAAEELLVVKAERVMKLILI